MPTRGEVPARREGADRPLRLMGRGAKTALWAALSVANGLAAAAADPVAEQGLVWMIEQARLHERNPLRTATESAASDAAWTSAIEGRYAGGWEGQRFSAFGRWLTTRYDQQDALDHRAYRTGMAWDLRTAGDWGARLSWDRRQDPLEGQVRTDPETGSRRVQSLEQAGGILRWGVHRRWGLDLHWVRERMDPNRPQPWWSGYEQDNWRLQWRGEWSRRSSWGLGYRRVMGTQFAVDAPASSQPAQDYRVALWEAEWGWQPREGDLLSLRLAAGDGQRQWMTPATGLAPPSNSQVARSLAAEWRWQPTAHWSLRTQIGRDEGQQTQGVITALDRVGLALQGASDVRQARVGLQWEPTRRFQTFAGWQRVQRLGRQTWMFTEGGSVGGLDEARWQDRWDRTSWGLSWQLGHGLSLRCLAQRETKRGSGFGTLVATSTPDRLVWRDTAWQCGLGWQSGLNHRL